MDLVHGEEAYAVLGACFEVYREMGCGFLEPVYQECLSRELQAREIPHVSQPRMALRYKGRLLEQRYQPDFVCFEAIIVEIKAVRQLLDEHRAQVQNYIRASQIRLGLLVNFSHYPKLQYERIVV